VRADIKKLALFSLRGALEAATMIKDIGEDVESPNPTPEQRDARKALTEAAAALSIDPKVVSISPEVFGYTLTFVTEDPYTQFIWNIRGVF